MEVFNSIITFTIFALFHSITPQEWFKNWLAKYLGKFFVEHFWRFPYCAISILLLYEVFLPNLRSFYATHDELLFIYPNWLSQTMNIVYLLGILTAYWAFLQVDYLEFWGVKQIIQGVKALIRNEKNHIVHNVAGIERLEVTGIYKLMRHPMLTGGFLMLLASPPTTTALVHFLLYSIYMVIGGYYEEKRLIKNIGPAYERYCEEVGAFFPRPLKAQKVF